MLCFLILETALLLLHDEHRVELIRGDVLEGGIESEFQEGAQVQGAAEELALLRPFGRLQVVQGAWLAVLLVRADLLVAELLAAETPIDDEPE